MHFKRHSEYLIGLFSVLSITIVSLWLARQGRLILYIHPRYVMFTAIMCMGGLICAVAGMGTATSTAETPSHFRISRIGIGTVCVLLCIGLLVARPAPLTSSAAMQRGINTGANVSANVSLADLSAPTVDYERFSMKEWVSLLSQTSDARLFSDKHADLVGFVSPLPDNNPNIFYLSRFVITCCTVDARPIGVAVYQPGWKSAYKVDQWLRIRGSFSSNSENSVPAVVLIPESVTSTVEPKVPYVY